MKIQIIQQRRTKIHTTILPGLPGNCATRTAMFSTSNTGKLEKPRITKNKRCCSKLLVLNLTCIWVGQGEEGNISRFTSFSDCSDTLTNDVSVTQSRQVRQKHCACLFSIFMCFLGKLVMSSAFNWRIFPAVDIVVRKLGVQACVVYSQASVSARNCC